MPGQGRVRDGLRAGALTFALGETYIAALDRVFARSKADTPSPAAIEAEFRKRIRQARRDTRRAGPRRGIRRLWPLRTRNRPIQDGDS